MKKNMENTAEYYDNHDFGDEMREAAKSGNLIFCKAGESALEAAKRRKETKKQLAAATVAAVSRRSVAAAVL